MRTFLILLVSLIIASCQKNDNMTLNKCWALGETIDNVMVFYRCNDERLTPNSFRESYVFQSNNRVKYLVLHPADAHYFEDGFYEYDLETSSLSIIDRNNKPLVNFRILAIQNDQIKLELIDN